MVTEGRKVNAPSKDVTIKNVWEAQDYSRPRNRVLLAEEPKDLLIAINCYSPGARNEMHFHVGSGQTFLVLKGPATLRHRHKDLPPEETKEDTLSEGDCIMIPANVYYQIYNPGPHQVLLYQVKQPGELISVEGKGVVDTSAYFTRDREQEVDLAR